MYPYLLEWNSSPELRKRACDIDVWWVKRTMDPFSQSIMGPFQLHHCPILVHEGIFQLPRCWCDTQQRSNIIRLAGEVWIKQRDSQMVWIKKTKQDIRFLYLFTRFQGFCSAGATICSVRLDRFLQPPAHSIGVCLWCLSLRLRKANHGQVVVSCSLFPTFSRLIVFLFPILSNSSSYQSYSSIRIISQPLYSAYTTPTIIFCRVLATLRSIDFCC